MKREEIEKLIELAESVMSDKLAGAGYRLMAFREHSRPEKIATLCRQLLAQEEALRVARELILDVSRATTTDEAWAESERCFDYIAELGRLAGENK